MTRTGLPALPLRDIHPPPAPEFWPPAPGWWLLGFLILILLIWAGLRLYRRLRLRRWRIKVLQELEALNGRYSSGEQTPQFLAQVSVLLRRVAVKRFSRRRVAQLTGRGWLDFLDATGGDGRFTQGAGQILAEGPYQPQASTARTELLALARDWIEKNTNQRMLEAGTDRG